MNYNKPKDDETLERLNRELVQPIPLEDLKVSFIAPTHRHLDFFLGRVYQYHLSRGYIPLLASRFTSLLSIGFTLLFSTFLIAFVNWNNLIECAYDRGICSQLSIWRSVSEILHSSSIIFISVYFIIFSLYGVWNLVTLGYEIQDYNQVRTFYREKLEIDDHRLREWEWGGILRLCIDKLEPNKEPKEKGSFTASGDRQKGSLGVSVLDYTSRMLRVENYITALLNAQTREETTAEPVLDLSYKSFDLFGMTVEWSIWWCIFLSGGIFTPTARLHKEDIKPEALRSRIWYTSILFAFLMPFLLLFMMMMFILKQLDRFSNSNLELYRASSRECSLRTKWMLREYNELQETHTRRLQQASSDADQYLNHFTNPLTETLGRFVGFVSGSIVGVLLVLTLVDSNILLYITLGEKTLVWHLALWSAILTLSRLFVSKTKQSKSESIETIHQDFRTLAKSMKWCKKEWQHRAHTEEVYHDVSMMFPPSIVLFCRELVATFLTPWTLYTRFYPKANQISEFIIQSTRCIPSIGDVCYHSTLQIHDEEEQLVIDIHSEHPSSGLYCSKFIEPKSKLQQSTLSFIKQYPDESFIKDLEESFMPTATNSMIDSFVPEKANMSFSTSDSIVFTRPRKVPFCLSTKAVKELRFSTFESILEESFNYEE